MTFTIGFEQANSGHLQSLEAEKWQLFLQSMKPRQSQSVPEGLEDSWRAAGIQSSSEGERSCSLMAAEDGSPSSSRGADALREECKQAGNTAFPWTSSYLGHLLESAAHTESQSFPSVNPLWRDPHRHMYLLGDSIHNQDQPLQSPFPSWLFLSPLNYRSHICLLQFQKMQLNIKILQHFQLKRKKNKENYCYYFCRVDCCQPRINVLRNHVIYPNSIKQSRRYISHKFPCRKGNLRDMQLDIGSKAPWGWERAQRADICPPHGPALCCSAGSRDQFFL